MKKLLLTTAIAGVAFTATPAAAEGVKLEVGGWFKGYGVFVDQDNAPDDSNGSAVDEATETNDFDFVRHTEIHFGGETTLDNGLTVGAHIETEADAPDAFEVEESYIYMSGAWGRVNVGAEDGAAYLLQVAAPAADENIDGIRQYVQPVNYVSLTQANSTANSGTSALLELFGIGNAAATATTTGEIAIDYDQNITGYSDKITYLTPILNGFQAGLSYTPDSDSAGDFEGVGLDNVLDTYGDGYEAALRYEGQFNNVGINFGAGYSLLTLESAGSVLSAGAGGTNSVAVGDPTDDREAWNVGLDLDIGPFGIGTVYKEDDAGDITNIAPAGGVPAVTADDEETWVFGADYTTGPFKLGVSYLNQNNTFGINNLDTERYSGGVTYTYGPGMTFRGSIGYIEHKGEGIGGNFESNAVVANSGNIDDVDATYFALGTQINF